MGFTDAVAYPLSWPVGRPRSKTRMPARFSTRGRNVTIAAALDRMATELRKMGVSPLNVVVSTNIPTRRDGLPMNSAPEAADTGVAVYFKLGKDSHCLSCDKWDRTADNIVAIASHILATRGQLRWGVGTVEQAFAGFKALPEVDAKPPWWQVLELSPNATYEVIKSKYRELMKVHHPDISGNHDRAAEINAALDAALATFENR